MTTPRGYRAAGPWYYSLDSLTGEGPLEFRLVPDAVRDQDSFSFVQITDLHVGFSGFGEQQPLELDLKAILAGWGSRPSFFAVTGDLSDHGNVPELIACRKALDTIPVPVFTLPGNHDYYQTRSPEAYRRVFGPASYSFDWGPVHFVAYDSVSDGPDAPGREWLAQDLAAQPPDRPVIMLLHYQLADDFFRLWRNYPIVASISGHWHSSRVWHDGWVTHFNGPPLSFGGIDYSPRGFRAFHWENGRLTAETIPLATRDDGAALWRMPRVDPPRRGAARKDAEPLALLWRRPLPGRVHMASPVAAGGRLYVASTSEDGPGRAQVAALDLAGGEVLWRRSVGDSVKNRLCSGGDLLFGVTVTGDVFALWTETGKEVWRRSLNDPSSRWAYSAPLYHEERLYVGTAGHFLCLDAASGSVLWQRTDLGESDWISSYTSPSLAGTTLLLGFVWQPWVLFGLDAATGTTRWVKPRSEGNCSAISTAADGYAYVLRHPGVLQKLAPETGELVWEASGLSRWSPAAPVVSQGRVFVSTGGRVLCYDAEKGRLIWSYTHPRKEGPGLDPYPYGRGRPAILGSPALSGSTLWVACGDGELLALRADSGALELRHPVGAPVFTAPLPIGGRLIVADAAGTVQAWRTPENE